MEAVKVFTIMAMMLMCTVSNAADPTKTFIILAGLDGPGVTAFLPALEKLLPTPPTTYKELGIVVAKSADPKFLTLVAALPGVSSIAEDKLRQWVKLPTAPVEVNPVVNRAKAGGRRLAAAINPVVGKNPEPYAPLQWNLAQIHADQAAENGDRGASARVAILDTGVVVDHVDIAASLNTKLSKSLVPGDKDDDYVFDPASKAFSHGTHVAGIITAPINGQGTQGVAPEAELVVLKVLSDDGWGYVHPRLAALHEAVVLQADVAVWGGGNDVLLGGNNGVVCANCLKPGGGNDVIYGGSNDLCRLGGGNDVIYGGNDELCRQGGGNDVLYGGNSDLCRQGGGNDVLLGGNNDVMIAAIHRAVDYATSRGVVVVASAGNEGKKLGGPCTVGSVPTQAGNGIAVTGTAPSGFGVLGNDADFDQPASYGSLLTTSVSAPAGDFVYIPKDPTACSSAPISGFTFPKGAPPCAAFDSVLAPGGNGNTYWLAASTSVAAAHVSGVAALIVGKNGPLPAEKLTALVFRSAVDILEPGPDGASGKGRVDATAALK